MFRIVVARSGYYYVQRYNGYTWKMTGGFFRTRGGARNFAATLRRGRCCCPRVVEYC